MQERIKNGLINGYCNATEFAKRRYTKFLENKANHNKWLKKYKVLKWFLVLTQLRSFLEIFYLLSISIISENFIDVNELRIVILIYSMILIITSYFSRGMYEDKNDLMFSYLKIILGIYLVKSGIFYL